MSRRVLRTHYRKYALNHFQPSDTNTMYQISLNGGSPGVIATPGNAWHTWGGYEYNTDVPGPGAYCLYPTLPAKPGQQFTFSFGWVPTPYRGIAKVSILDGSDTPVVFYIDQTNDPVTWAQTRALTYQTIQNPTAGSISCVNLLTITSPGTFFSVRVEKSGGTAGDGIQIVADFLLYSSPEPLPKPAKLDRAVVSPSGKSLALFVSDLSGNPSKITALTGNPTISVNGGIPLTLNHPIWAASAPAQYVLYPLTGTAGVLSQPLQITDTVTVSCPDGWATSVAGDVEHATSIPATRVTKTLLPPFDPNQPKTMKVGYNLEGTGATNPTIIYPNLARGIWYEDWQGDLSLNDARYPVSMNSGSSAWTMAVAPFGPYWNTPAGTYTVRYRTTTPGLVVNVGDMFENHGVGTPTMTTLPDGRIQIQRRLEDSTAYGSECGPQVVVTLRRTSDPINDPFGYSHAISGPYNIDLRDLEIYPPGIDPDNPPLVHHETLRMLSGTSTIRLLNALPLNGRGIGDYYNPAEVLSCRMGRKFYQPIQSIAPFTGDPHWTKPYWKRQVPILVTFQQPHPFQDGDEVSFSNILGPNGDGTFPIGGGTYSSGVNQGQPTPDSVTSLNQSYSYVQVVSPTEIVLIANGIWNAEGTSLKGTFSANLGPKASVYYQTRTGMDLADTVEICNQVGSIPWIGVPTNISDPGVTQLFTIVANTLRRDLKCRLEYSNETWNLSFNQFVYCSAKGFYENPAITLNQYTVKRSGQIANLARAAFVAAGRPATDLIHVIGTQVSWSAVASERVQYAADNNIQFDELACAPYFWSGPYDAALGPIYDAMDQDQLMDVAELSMGYAFTAGIAEHRAILDRLYPSAKVVCYEGGPEYGGLNTAVAGEDGNKLRAARSRAWARNSRMFGIILNYLQQLQDQGCTEFTDYKVNGIMGNAVVSADAMWAAHIRWNQPDGLGDGSDGLFNNNADPENNKEIVSVVGAALRYWNSLVANSDRAGITPRRARSIRRR